jgi:catechol 2,3-dioxygenase-like lactoylglutathione lyase family enzyme
MTRRRAASGAVVADLTLFPAAGRDSMKPSAFLGLRTVIYYVPDLDKAKQWYRSVLGIDPYFDEPFYVGFNVGGFELGLHPAEGDLGSGAGGAVTYWGVPNAAEAWKRLLGLGAVAASEPQNVGGDIVVATVKDPFGNLLGVIENPDFPNTA